MNKKRILLSSPHMSEQGYEQEFVKEAFDTNWIAPLGANVDKFEDELAKFVGIKHAAALSSGTSALHLALKAADVKRDDIVLCQSLTFSATVNPILYEGAIPVLIDSDFDTWNMSPIYLRAALEKYPHAKAVVVVHLYGLSADLEAILSVCNEFGVTLIEDAAESLGTTYKGKYTGTFGKYGIYSFNGNKIITTSGGGMLISNDEDKIEKARFWSTQSREKVRYYEHKELGYNYRMSNIVAGIGRGQLKVLNDRIKKKNSIYNFYKSELDNIDEIGFMPNNVWNEPNFWLSVITLENTTPDKLINFLEKENIEARPVWKPMHLQPFLQGYDYIGEKVAEQLYQTGVCLPSDSKMNNEDLLRVTNAIKKVLSI
ncbi:hypothetical protein IGI96_002712 [Enterococcus sp. DIV0421]|uniref:DegT/DnrJ/EryC1/StrS family aminotransferase n=1 Tax=Enterococcus sp. DIV0421 TaxID=2774688 RepID=UPI003F263B92